MIAFLIGILIRRAGLAMGVFFIYMIIEQVVVGILRNRYKIDAVDYLPEEVSDRLVPQPYLQKMLASDEWIAKWHPPSSLVHCRVNCLPPFIYSVYRKTIQNK